MARTALCIITPKGPYSEVSAGDLDFIFEAADDINGNAFPCTGRELILIRNSDETNAATVTISSAPDPYGRTKDISTYAPDAGEFSAFWVGKTIGWKQSDGMVYLDVAGTGTIEFAVLRPPE